MTNQNRAAGLPREIKNCGLRSRMFSTFKEPHVLNVYRISDVQLMSRYQINFLMVETRMNRLWRLVISMIGNPLQTRDCGFLSSPLGDKTLT